MNILMVLEAPYPMDIRVNKQAKALISAGHQVYLLCTRRKGQPKSDKVDGIHIYRINVGQSDYVLAFWDVINSINFYHPKFARIIANLVKFHKIHVIHVHDLPLAGTALKLRKKLDVKVVVDLHENYPEALKIWHQWKKNPIAQLKNKLFLNYQKWIKYERYAVTNSDLIISVVMEMQQRLTTLHKVSPDKIAIITNTEEKTFIKQPTNKGIYGRYKNDFIITYTGGIGPHRGVDTLIEAMSMLKKYSDIVLFLAGQSSKSVRRHLQALIKKYSLVDRVFLLGYQPFLNFYSLMKFSSVNVIPHHSNEHTNNTIPHKLFQGMMSGNPLLVSTSSAIKRVVQETNSGLIFEAGDAIDLAGKLEELYQNESLRKQLAKNGITATINGSYNWEHTSEELVKAYDNLACTI
ncbi:Putative glycosyl transferase [Fulvivirga imtechensis AK7]|uniref:Putative glycosyl transferase n=1 Tax=Fulvivirga imtechensis AK7 TaxID=1237149 RepID=L8JKX8_9BACT|nr:glycosyltransferase family 4 protein [Fulvivirga imtechensis]ELR69586.1 Putative glycosyl transferase [Fulvivirga imtechensis AK7]